jgi:asparagine N-glycosylation enzyme membrane subunit Stt3
MSYIAVAVAFVSEFSPVLFCIVVPLILLTLYVSGKTSSKIGEAYDFGTLKGCLAHFIIILVIAVAAGVILLIVGQAFGTMLQSVIPRL